jgi:hypothetical protein
MSNLNDEMKSTADYAIKAAKERYGQDLDYSEESINKLENLLLQLSQAFSNNGKDEDSNSVISDTATLWGSYLGEYMRLKWGGTWIAKDSDRLVSIINIEFSPISLVYQKITSHPEYSVENYLNETKRLIYTTVINPQQSQNLSENIGQSQNQISADQSKTPVTIDKHLLFILAGIGGLLLVIAAFIIGYKNIKPGGISGLGSSASATHANTNIPIGNSSVTPTHYFTDTPFLTATLLPTYTPHPTITPRPSFTPIQTNTQIGTSTSTETQKTLVVKPTLAPKMSPTSGVVTPPDTPIPPTVKPPPTATVPPPVTVVSCEISPSTVPAGLNTTITFIMHFSTNIPGYGFEAAVDPKYPGQTGCVANNSDSTGTAFCDGSSGMLPDLTTVAVTLRSSVGDCVASYSSP